MYNFFLNLDKKLMQKEFLKKFIINKDYKLLLSLQRKQTIFPKIIEINNYYYKELSSKLQYL